ncbi:MAG: protein-L-isoaspartate(D-aspartate) O-methyltransferase [Alphaproteobacteria bacterium]|nr:protein-L-isoaspartate(D-aspartate) O-methyltransferase [Alphaproteobacteria bacterium]
MAAAAWLIAAALLALPLPAGAQAPGNGEARSRMVELIERLTELTSDTTGVDKLSERVVAAFRKVPRDAFVPPRLGAYAYADTPLPLGHGQNLAQPFIAALMTHLLDVKPGEKVFETGTDTGYHAAILSEMGVEVHSVEIVEPLLTVARRLLAELGYRGVRLRAADGYSGWPEHAPYDAILVKESSTEVPPPLWRQLKPGGRMVIPLGPPDGPQYLTVVRKEPDGTMRQKRYFPVRFAPFQGGERT